MVWSGDDDKVSSIAADGASLELAVGKSDGTITLWDTQTWTVKSVLRSERSGCIVALKYVTAKISSSPQTFLLVSCIV